MFKPWFSKSPTNTDDFHIHNGQNETYENNLDDFTLYLSDVGSHQINPTQVII